MRDKSCLACWSCVPEGKVCVCFIIPEGPVQGLARMGGSQVRVEDQWLREGGRWLLGVGWGMRRCLLGGRTSSCPYPLLPGTLADPRVREDPPPIPGGAAGIGLPQTPACLAQAWRCGQWLQVGFLHWCRFLNLLCLCQSFSSRVSAFSLIIYHTRDSQAFHVSKG